MSCTINAVAETLRLVSRYLDEISLLPELANPYSTRIETDTIGQTCVTVYLAAHRVSESEAIDRLRTLAGLLDGRIHLGEPIGNDERGTFRALDVLAAIPTGGTLRIWSPIATTDPVPAEPVAESVALPA